MGRAEGSTALILAGAAAKGAFEAGAIAVLAERGVRIDSVMGTSSGALNAAVMAAGVRGDRDVEAGKHLLTIWREHCEPGEAFQLSLRDIMAGRGIATADRVQQIMLRAMRSLVAATRPADRRPVDLRLVVSPLAGHTEPGTRATTFELPLHFTGESLDTEEGRQAICEAAAASAAFPLAYAPKELSVGPCIDGGVVNNTPVKHAIEGSGEREVTRVIVIAPHPETYSLQPGTFGDYVVHLLTVVTQERLYRDMKYTMRVNERLAALQDLVKRGVLNEEQLEAVRRVLGWKPLTVIAIRPDAPLRGNPFAAFWEKSLRIEYIEAGRAAAEKALGAIEASGG